MELSERLEMLSSASQWEFSDRRALYINCTLEGSPEMSHTQGLIDRSIEIVTKNGVAVEAGGAVDHELAPGVWPI